ncbi:MAG TPA: glycoside hydrolase family 5 protein [Chloroflexota bacterium]|nr:glycoside hydrolase family 5 protein [Chloroflexota bacterium]
MRSFVLATLSLAALLVPLQRGVSTAQAGSVAPQALALPASLFPRWAAVHGRAADNAAADAANAIHTETSAQLGRADGYIQRIGWSLQLPHRRTYRLTVRYSAAQFQTPEQAATGLADARVSLWEIGQPFGPGGGSSDTFRVALKGKSSQLWAVQSGGVFESELSLQSPATLPTGSQLTVNALFGRIRHAARAILRRLAGLASRSAGLQPLPAIAVAPWGTGPVVKSPSLMVVGAAGAPQEADLTPGVFRPDTRPPEARSARPGVVLAALGGSSRFVRAVTTPTGELYDSATVFGSPLRAQQELERITAANERLSRLPVYDVHIDPNGLPGLGAADAIKAWQGASESVVLVRLQNVVMILAGAAPPGALLTVADGLAGTVPSWLHAAGTSIVNAAGRPVHLTALNWYGAEEQDFVVGGLDYRPYQSILNTVATLGYNTIRLLISNQLVEQNPIVVNHVRANPELRGLHALDILDRIVNYAGAVGLSVILDDHRSDAGWSAQDNGLWYTPDYPESAFIADWQTMAQRYSASDVVVGADLRNEPHGAATWGDGNQATDWRAAAQRAGNAVLAVNPHLLIIVEGIERYGNAPAYWWGGNLMGVATAPVTLAFADGSSARSQLVYSIHDYGPDICGTACPWFNATTSAASLTQLWEQYWGYITDDPSKPYAAPVWVGELGTCNYQLSCVTSPVAGSQGQWFEALVQYIGAKHLGWAYWSANATQSTAPGRTYGALDWYGFFDRSWDVPVGWVDQALAPIMTDAITGGPGGAST